MRSSEEIVASLREAFGAVGVEGDDPYAGGWQDPVEDVEPLEFQTFGDRQRHARIHPGFLEPDPEEAFRVRERHRP